MLIYIPLSFLFSFKKGFGLKILKNRVRVRRVLGFGFGIGNLIGGAVGTVGSALARRLCLFCFQMSVKLNL